MRRAGGGGAGAAGRRHRGRGGAGGADCTDSRVGDRAGNEHSRIFHNHT